MMNGRSNTYRAMLCLALCGGVTQAVLAQVPVRSDEDAPAVQAAPDAVTRPEVEHELPAPSVARSTSEPAVPVRVFPRLLPRSLTPPDASYPRAKYIVHLDDQGRVVPPPPRGTVRATRAPAPQFVYTFVGTSAGGGIGSVVSHLRSYSYAAVGPDGTLRSGCVQGSLEEAQAKAGALAGKDEPRAGNAGVKHDRVQD